MKKHTSVVKALLLFGVSMIVVLVVTILVVVSSLFNRGVSRTVNPLFEMATSAAVKAVTPGLQLDSKDEIATALRPFAENPLFTSIRVKNASGAEVFAYRKQGLGSTAADTATENGEHDGRWFGIASIQADGITLGTLTVSISLADRDAAVASTRVALLTIGVVGIVVMALSLRQLLHFKLERPLQAATAEIRESAAQVLKSSEAMAASSTSLSRGATEQAASLEETSASMEQMASMTRRNAESAMQATALVSEVAKDISASNDALGATVTSMTRIEESSGKVAKIIKTIDEIAFQTNILALNAAVEAARAGDAGMGFAVVADEVRSLAQRSAQAAKDTASLIEESIERSHEGASKVQQVAAMIEGITERVARMKTVVEEVGDASHKQTLGIDQVSQSIAQMERVTQTTAATAEESAAASAEMNQQAESVAGQLTTLEALVGRRLGDRDGSARRRASSDAWARPVRPAIVKADEAHLAFSDSSSFTKF